MVTLILRGNLRSCGTQRLSLAALVFITSTSAATITHLNGSNAFAVTASGNTLNFNGNFPGPPSGNYAVDGPFYGGYTESISGNSLTISLFANYFGGRGSDTIFVDSAIFGPGSGSGWVRLTIWSDGIFMPGNARFGPVSCLGFASEFTTYCALNSLQPINFSQPIPVQMSVDMGGLSSSGRRIELRAEFFQDAAATLPLSVSLAPEPGTIFLLGGAAAVGLVRRWRRPGRGAIRITPAE